MPGEMSGLSPARSPANAHGVVRDDPGAAALSTDPVARALADIRHLTRAATLQLALDVGEIVFHHIFDADAQRVRRRGPKDASFRRLALHPELPMSATNLWRAVAIYEMSLRLPALTENPRLGVSHARAVLGLAPRNQEKLIALAEAEGWSVARLAQEAAQRRTGRGGRRRKTEIARVLDTLRRLTALPAAMVLDRSAVERLSDEDVEAGLETLREATKRLDTLQRTLRAARSRR